MDLGPSSWMDLAVRLPQNGGSNAEKETVDATGDFGCHKTKPGFELEKPGLERKNTLC